MAGEAAAVDWPKLKIGMLGGDKREQEIARRAAATGAEVRAHGFPWPVHGIPGVQHLTDPAAVLAGARFALFPIPGMSASGALFAPYLVALGAHTHVAARNPEQRAAAFVAGATPHELAELPKLAPRLDLLFSTVPVRVVGEDVLARLPKAALVVDLAAPPGGVDFDAAKRLGINAIWGRGLGSRAPVTVGASQWGGIRERIEKILQEEP